MNRLPDQWTREELENRIRELTAELADSRAVSSGLLAKDLDSSAVARDRIEELKAERDRLISNSAAVLATLDQFRAENALLRKALERFLETTEGEDAVSGMALHGPITLARAALARIPEAKP